jgi:hypothetical protein
MKNILDLECKIENIASMEWTVPTENGNEHFVNIAFMVNKAKK